MIAGWGPGENELIVQAINLSIFNEASLSTGVRLINNYFRIRKNHYDFSPLIYKIMLLGFIYKFKTINIL